MLSISTVLAFQELGILIAPVGWLTIGVLAVMGCVFIRVATRSAPNDDRRRIPPSRA